MTSHDIQDRLRRLPAVGQLLNDPTVGEWLKNFSVSQVTESLRRAVDVHRQRILNNEIHEIPSVESIVKLAETLLVQVTQPSLRRVINATGIVLHTGLGRAPLSWAALDAIQQTAAGYCNLEYDLTTSERGHRTAHVRDLLCRLTGAEDATVVNNNAAATLLVLKAVAHHYPDGSRRYRQRNVIVSRGQLVEIGGSFRLPEIMKESGVTLKEVGTTNRTRLSDYEQAIDERTAALMRVHTSNYRITGFSEEASIEQLTECAHRHHLPVIDDLGSGAMLQIGDEPLVKDSVSAGADLVCFSGDKLLGGPQAGIILGNTVLVQWIEKNPLMRTYRVDKMVLAALESTLRLYEDPERAHREIPVWAMLCQPIEQIHDRANQLAAALSRVGTAHQLSVEVVEDVSYAGGGSLPTQKYPTWTVRLRHSILSADELAQRLRRSDPPIIVRIHKDQVIFDCRTMQDDELCFINKNLHREISCTGRTNGS